MTTRHRKQQRSGEFRWPPYRWPPYPTFTFYNGRGKVLFQESDPALDFSDTLMLNRRRPSRLIYLGIRSRGRSWTTWTEPRLQHVEKLIKYDLNFDGNYVSIFRITKHRWQPCTREFRWKLQIRATWH